ncbi:MAG: chorismate lyase [Pseudomonadota bacterium]
MLSSVSEPRWQSLRRGILARAPRELGRWVRDDSSLTRRVVRACGADFAVKVIFQGWQRPYASEAALLGTPPRERTLVREVTLMCGADRWVFARTLIPLASLRGRAVALATLGARPLGAVLFADPTTRRRRVEVARIRPGHRLYTEAVEGRPVAAADLWGRRTLFVFGGRPLLVNEIFLPAIAQRTGPA